MKIYKCQKCGKLTILLNNEDVPTVCCGEVMSALNPNTVDAAVEKHLPVITKNNNIVTVTVSDVAHPMLEEHYITFIILETTNGFQIKNLKPNTEPKADFVLADGEEIISALEYCNLHGLWQTKN